MNYYEKARNFAVKYIDPVAKELDENNKFPSEIFNKLGEEGFFKLIIPTELGGDGKGYQEHAEVVQALAESNASVGLSFMMHNVPLSWIISSGNNKLKERVITDIVENNVTLALGGTEAGHGVNMQKSDFKVENSDEQINLSGRKHMVTGGGYAKWYMVNAPTKTGSSDLAQYFVSKDMKGVSFDEGKWNGIGMRANNSVPMILDNVAVTTDLRLVPDEKIKSNYYFTLGLAAVYAGLNVALLQEAKQHVQSRVYPDGSNLASIETVQIHLADLYTHTLSATSSTKEAAEAASRQSHDAAIKVNAARVISSENAIKSANTAMRIGGGKSYNKANAIERLMRDAYAGPIMTPSVDVLKLAIGSSFK